MSRLYTKMKIFHFKEKLDSLPIERPEILPPIHIRIKPTNVCNHNCRYCAYKADNLQLGKDMNRRDFIARDKMLEIIHDIIDMGVKAVTFSGGGEPLVYPYITEAALTLAASGVKIATLTNGANLMGETAEVFAQSATWVRVSMDGYDDESYSRYRGVKHGEFTKIMRNLRDFKKLGGKCYLGVSFIVDKDNCSKVYAFTEKLREVGVDSVKVSPCIVSNEGAENNAYHKPFFELVKEQVARAKEDFCNETFEIFDSYHALDEKFKKDYSWCPYLQLLPVIGADCNVYSCQDKAYNLQEGLIGSIGGSARFSDFWCAAKANFFKINPSKVCNHHCVANEKNLLVHDYLEANMEHLGFV
ncbi:radical SAM protein [Candidatus Magnetomonas plexicatena]|uniref:radical SAM protein n=1 Tax=Candidatus Magnetomonas plexicatena TaxID=2552947 RepID=UPI0011038496|nr:radical SAM protein [Nitrospirales bacterium LBB_01]